MRFKKHRFGQSTGKFEKSVSHPFLDHFASKYAGFKASQGLFQDALTT
jgi:hypothetical protein